MQRITFSQAAGVLEDALHQSLNLVSPRFCITIGIDQDGKEFILLSDANEPAGDHFMARLPA